MEMKIENHGKMAKKKHTFFYENLDDGSVNAN